MERPRQHPDGSHEIPIQDIRCVGCETCEEATGTVRWSPEGGVSFEIDFPSVSQTTFPRYYRRNHSGKVGSLVESESIAHWTAQTLDGLEVQLFQSDETPSSKSYSGTSGSGCGSHIVGTATFAKVSLHRDNPLAFWHATNERFRMFFMGCGPISFSSTEEVSYQEDESIVTTNRCTLQLSESPSEVCLVAKGPGIRLPEGGWLTFEKSNVDYITFPHRAERSFISFLNGRRVPFAWADSFVDLTQVVRVYYGWERARLNEISETHTQPIPLSGTIAALQHREEVASCLPALFRSFVDLSEYFQFDRVLHPLWTANRSVLDDRIALASVSLERLATEWSKLRKSRPEQFEQVQDEIWNDSRLETVRKLLGIRLKDVLAEAGWDELDERRRSVVNVLENRISSIHKKPNVDRLVSIFSDLGIVVPPEDKKTLKSRDRSLHGSETLDGHSTPEYDIEVRRFDCIRMYITKAILAILGYRGPYINYHARPTQGNFPIEHLENNARPMDDSHEL